MTGKGWHTEIGIPAEELDDNLSFYRQNFAGADTFMFGYGKKTFFSAPAHSLNEYILGPFPGPGVIHVVGLRGTPVEAYPPDSTYTLTLPPGGARALSNFIWDDLVKDAGNNPLVVARSTEPDGLFYASKSEYNLFHTCNAWTADAVRATGLPIEDDNIVFSYQTMSHVNKVAQSQCQILH